MEDTSPGTSLVFTMTYGKAGLFLTPQGSSNSIIIDDILQHLRQPLGKEEAAPWYSANAAPYEQQHL